MWMPKRTNEFQQVVALICAQLASDGEAVTESNEIRDGVTGDPREVDITIQCTLGGMPSIVAIECRDRKRAQDVEWIDGLIGKYSGTPAKVVAVSSSGFTELARRKAVEVGIDVINTAEAKDRNWRAWVEDIDSIWVTIEGWMVEGVINIQLLDKRIRGSVDYGGSVGDLRFEIDGTRGQYSSDDVLWIYRERNRGTWRGLAEPWGSGSYRIRVPFPAWSVVVLPNGQRYGVEAVDFVVTLREEVINLPLQAGEFKVVGFASGKGKGLEFTVRVLFLKKEGSKEPEMVVQLLAPKGGEVRPGRYALYGERDPELPATFGPPELKLTEWTLPEPSN
jgi:hypothetical protein